MKDQKVNYVVNKILEGVSVRDVLGKAIFGKFSGASILIESIDFKSWGSVTVFENI